MPHIFEVFDDFGDVLGAVAGADEKCVRGFDDDEVFDADRGDEFARAVEEIAGRVEPVSRPTEDVFAWLLREKLVHCGPRPNIALA